ncbi:FAD/FMN-containing dehydrogenase [Pseudomassariella vexata]|uniref:FAD/FMN-containing dehydrogenase n=1 Tax=Pseudomassariella vexata TaxID=1141098 RepID=A0A1Y2DH29_9PEZI|nr:FAD/FMN-containing dehydrogenase [Pseudomassariella vexata]ORY58548.1 FAD/FMN-containing dehydrogenase [Pseudomassariella vexata]
MRSLTIPTALVAVLHAAATTALVPVYPPRDAASDCYCLPGDSCWPSASIWDGLNTTVSGRLVATVPVGSPCHDPTYDAEACAALQADWTSPETHIPSSSSVMQAFFANQSCDPFTDRSTPCLLGNYVSYAVNVTSNEDVIAALAFAQTNNIRVLVRNTGHDFLGRSTGAGALAIWTHHLKSVEFLDYSDSYYSGSAVKVGAGVEGYEALEAAAAEGVVIVTGECPTVGMAGGYTQGGGHSALTTTFGMAADQTLEFEVVTAAGDVVTASRTENSDLYWALSGGGGGTYGVVTSMTVRTHPDATVGGASLQLAAVYTTQDNFFEAVAQFHALLPAMIDQGAMVVYYVSSAVLVVNPITIYNSTGDHIKDTVLAPFLAVLGNLSIPYSASYTSLPYRDHYDTYMGPLPYGHVAVEEYQFGSRLIPRDVLENNNDAFQAVLRNLTENGVLAVGDGLNASAKFDVSNAVNPAWRDAGVHMQLTTAWDSTAPWEDMVAAQVQMTNEFVPQIEAVTPGSGAYFNEADFNQPNWQETFFGDNYDKLLTIKQTWDPNGVFYALKGVGSDAWTVAADGRMCRA